MQSNTYVIVQFQTNELYEKNIASINCSPQPESMLRLFMNYTPLLSIEAQTIKVVEPEVIPFTRNGFTLVEWGGSEVSSVELFSKIF